MNNTLRLLLRRTASTLLIVYCLYHGLYVIRGYSRDYLNPDPDPVTAFAKRFEALEAQLSRQGYRKVGYVTDMPEVADWFTEYFQLQYVLAPIIVNNSPDCRLVVANLHDTSSIEHIIRERNLMPVQVQDYGKGVLLLTKDSH